MMNAHEDAQHNENEEVSTPDLNTDLNTELHLDRQSPASRSSSSAPQTNRTHSGEPPTPQPLSVFDFVDYREFLNAFYENKRQTNKTYSMSQFIRRAGLGENSRGYLKMIIEGKRNLTPHTLMRFVDALGLTGKQAAYFENLVHYNQAKRGRDKEYYFTRMSEAIRGVRSKQFELLSSQLHYHSNWYYVAVREVVDLKEFREDPIWISQRLKKKVSPKEVQQALTDLETMGMVRRLTDGRLVQSEPLVKYTGGRRSDLMDQYQLQMMERAREALQEEEYDKREASSVTLSCDAARIPDIKKMIEEFRDRLVTTFGVGSVENNSIVQVNLQLFMLAEPDTKKDRSNK